MSNLFKIGFLALAVACGGSESTEEGTGGGEDMHAHEHDDGHHEAHDEGHEADAEHEYAEMPPALAAFHEAFAAHWHGDKSAEAVCPDVENLKGLSDAAGAEHPQHPDEVTELAESTQAVVDSCASGEGFDAAFDRMHNALHGVMHDDSHHDE